MNPIVDTGPLVALIDNSDRHSDWARNVFSNLHGPLTSCEAVIAEVLHLCRRGRLKPTALYALLESESLRIVPVLPTAAKSVVRLLQRYAQVPMSLADACLVRLHEVDKHSFIITCDSDFYIYRRSGNRAIEALMPNLDSH